LDESESDEDASNPISFSASKTPSVMSAAEEVDNNDVSINNTRLSRISEESRGGYSERVSAPESQKCNTCPILLDSISELETLTQERLKLVANVFSIINTIYSLNLKFVV
jgi:hypothetical protein